MKTCTKCKETKLLQEFPIMRKAKNGNPILDARCFECKRRHNRESLRLKRANKENRLKERHLDYKRRLKNPEKEMFVRAKKRAKDKQIAFTITVSDIIMPEICPLLGIPLKLQKGGASDCSPSLDRVDTTKGYVPGNVKVISRLANIMKAHADKELLLKFITNIPNYLSQ